MTIAAPRAREPVVERAASGLMALAWRWRLRRASAGLVLGAGLGALAFALCRSGGGDTASSALPALAGLLAGLLPWGLRVPSTNAREPGGDRRREAAHAMALHLDRVRPELQDSAELLLADPEALAPLVRAQRRRAAAALAALPRRGVLPWRGPALAAAVGVLALALALVVLAERAPGGRRPPPVSALPLPGAPAMTRVAGLEVTVTPPAYTGRAIRRGEELAVHAEQGAAIVWQVRVDGPGERALLLFGDERLGLSRGADGTFTGERRAETSTLYALAIEGGGRELWRSPSARLDVLPDQPPVLEIEQPRPLTEVSPESPGHLALTGRASDDYGLAGVELLITAVAGGGEQISVREERRPLAVATGRFAADLDLAALGVRKDTELYLRVEASDRRAPAPNRTRSETLRVRAVGPQELAAASLGAGLRLQPVLEFFRSERQIILDTEKLLADEPRIARAEFEQRSQSLAFDQRALRLRYGALLGEEFESGAAVEAGAEEAEHLEIPGHEATAPAEDGTPGGETTGEHAPKIGKAKAAAPRIEDLLPAGMVHQHDAQDEATFFTGALRTQLKAVLAEMWGAEGKLRVFDARRALPFENRALVLLKELQQQARVYVPKIGTEAPEIDLTRRLQGELDKIHDLARSGPATRPEAAAALRRVLGAAADAAAAMPAAADLAEARRALSAAALAGDGDALGAVDALRSAEEGGWPALGERDRERLRRALWRALPAPDPLPLPRLDDGFAKGASSAAVGGGGA